MSLILGAIVVCRGPDRENPVMADAIVRLMLRHVGHEALRIVTKLHRLGLAQCGLASALVLHKPQPSPD